MQYLLKWGAWKLDPLPETDKIAIVYTRVSTKGQDDSSQVHMGEELAKQLGYASDKVIVIRDQGVSARQRSLDERDGIVKVLDYVRKGIVGHVIVRDRDRLARNMFEYLYIWKVIHNAGARICLSIRGAIPVSDDYGIEATEALTAEIEGNNIVERSRAAGQYYPSAPIGYIKVGRKGDTHYERNEDADTVLDLFDAFARVGSKTEYQNFASLWRKRVGCPPEKVLTNLLYAGSISRGDGYEKVYHVDPLVDVDVVMKNRDQLRAWGLYGQEREPHPSSAPRLVVPVYCTQCGEELEPYKRKGERLYRCKRCKGHAISETLIASEVSQTIQCVLSNLSVESIENRTKSTIRRLRTELMHELVVHEEGRSRVRRRVLDSLDSPKIHETLSHLHEIEANIRKTKQRLFQVDQVLEDIEYIRKTVLSHIDHYGQTASLYLQRLIISRVGIDDSVIVIEYGLFDLLNKEGIADAT